MIYTNPQFQIWKQEIQLELQGIYDRQSDKFIFDSLLDIKQGFNGWRDEESFNKVVGSLLAIKKNIDKYYDEELAKGQQYIEQLEIGDNKVMENKCPKIFISHATQDKEYVAR